MQTLAPFGLRPAYFPTGDERAKVYTIASAYNTSIYKGDPVILNTNGTITIGTAAADILGVFDGVEYTDVNGKPTYSNFWPANQAVLSGTAPVAYVWDDPAIVYEVQAGGQYVQADIGEQADIVMGAGSTQTGLSTSYLSASKAGAGVQAQFRVVGFNLDPNNAIGDTYPILQVQIARHQYVANKVAI